jgi:hypothetical protein
MTAENTASQVVATITNDPGEWAKSGRTSGLPSMALA